MGKNPQDTVGHRVIYARFSIFHCWVSRRWNYLVIMSLEPFKNWLRKKNDKWAAERFFWWQNCNKWWSETFKRKTLLLCLHPSIQSPFWWPLRYKKGSNFYAHIDLHCLSEKWMGRENAHFKRFLKIVQKVSFNIAKFTFWVDKNWLKGQNWASLRSNSVARQVSSKRT